MSRRHRAEKRQVVPDARYKSPLVAHLVNVIMKSGKKNIAQRIVYGAFEKMSEKLEKGDPVDLMLGALENARPRHEVKSPPLSVVPPIRVPVEFRIERQESLALRWLVDAAAQPQPAIPDEGRPLGGRRSSMPTTTRAQVVKKKEAPPIRWLKANRAFRLTSAGNQSGPTSSCPLSQAPKITVVTDKAKTSPRSTPKDRRFH
jgi:small subunit ribosomal protein S7